MEERVSKIQVRFSEALKGLKDSRDIEDLKTQYLGKKGEIQELMAALRDSPPDQRPEHGKLINALKVSIETELTRLEVSLLELEESARLKTEKIDISLPGRKGRLGRRHPLTRMMDEVLGILMEMGFSVQYSPEIESEYNNFDALNMGPDHPARDMQDTFYLNPDFLLRTHTSPTQIRVMERHQPPIRIVAPGRCYRNEDVTPRSHVIFHQVEGLYIDRGVTLADLTGTLQVFLNKLFHAEVCLRFRSSYFPFVEPGIEVDLQCLACGGKGCPLCKQTGWLEVLGAGMVHPEVLRNVGIDPEEFTGFAWGMGIDRMLLMRAGIDDIRMLTENDLRLLAQFPHV